jgi:hypothetical protein
LFRGDMLADPQQRSFSSCSSKTSIWLQYKNDSCSTNLGFLKFFYNYSMVINIHCTRLLEIQSWLSILFCFKSNIISIKTKFHFCW